MDSKNENSEDLDALFAQCEAQYEAEQAAKAALKASEGVETEIEDDGLIHLPAYALEAGTKFREQQLRAERALGYAEPKKPRGAWRPRNDQPFEPPKSRAKVAQPVEEGKPEEKRAPGRPSTVNPDSGPSQLFTIRLPKALHMQFKQYCNLRGLLMSEVVRNYIEDLVGNADNSPEALRKLEFEMWLEKYKRITGANTERMLEMFRQTEEDIANAKQK